MPALRDAVRHGSVSTSRRTAASVVTNLPPEFPVVDTSPMGPTAPMIDLAHHEADRSPQAACRHAYRGPFHFRLSPRPRTPHLSGRDRLHGCFALWTTAGTIDHQPYVAARVRLLSIVPSSRINGGAGGGYLDRSIVPGGCSARSLRINDTSSVVAPVIGVGAAVATSFCAAPPNIRRIPRQPASPLRPVHAISRHERSDDGQRRIRLRWALATALAGPS